MSSYCLPSGAGVELEAVLYCCIEKLMGGVCGGSSDQPMSPHTEAVAHVPLSKDSTACNNGGENKSLDT